MTARDRAITATRAFNGGSAHILEKLAPDPDAHIAFLIPGPPVPKERARIYTTSEGKRKGVTPGRTRSYAEHVALCALAARQKCRAWNQSASAYAIEIRVFEPPSARGDIDNYFKGLTDPLQNILFGNDRRIKRMLVSVDVDRTNPRAEVEVWAL